MPRGLTANFIAAATSSVCHPAVLFEGEFASSTLRFWNGVGDLTWNSQTWVGGGFFTGIEGGEETVEVEAVTMTVTLSGVPSAVVSLVLGDQKQGAPGTLYIAMLSAAGAVIADPYVWWRGKYSHAEIDESADESTARLYYDSPLVDLDRSREGRWTHDAQQKLFPGDKGFEYVVAASDWNGDWGGTKNKPSENNKKKKKQPRGSPKRHGR
jgi:hypothetical protein